MKHIQRDFSLKVWVDLGDGAKAKIQLFSEHGHVAYQIKGNDACRNMVANILLVDFFPLTLFQNIVVLHISN